MTSWQEHAEDPGEQVRARVLTMLTQAMVPTGDPGGDAESPLPLRLCRMFVEATGATGGAITLAPTELHRMTLCTTDGTAARLENLQEVIGEGPVIEAASSMAVVAATLRDEADRWPALVQTVAIELGPVSMNAFPMLVGPDAIGVISVYRDSDDGTWRPQLDEAVFLANTLGAAIVSAGIEGDSAVTWDVRDRINQAIGMVIGQLGFSPQDAVALMRAAAFSTNIDLGEMATEIIEHRRDFSRDEDSEGDQP